MGMREVLQTDVSLALPSADFTDILKEQFL